MDFLCFVSMIGWRGCMGLRDFVFSFKNTANNLKKKKH